MNCIRSRSTRGTAMSNPKNSGANSPAAFERLDLCREFASSLPLLHHVAEVVKEIVRIMRPGCRFRVVLDAKKGQRFVAQAFQCLVVQVDVGQFNLVGVDRIGIDGEVVVVSRDLYLAGGVVLYRMIAAVMA